MAALLFHRALSGSLNQSRLSFSELQDASFGLRYAPALGAIQIVKSINDLFRTPYHQGDPIPLRSLEYLVSSFTMYETSEPRDVIFSLLSISRDALREDQTGIIETSDIPIFGQPGTERVLHSLMSSHVRAPFRVDYSAPVLEVYKQFMSFSIPRANPSRALDIICRPWAPDLPGEKFPSWIATLTNAAYKPVDRSALGRRLIRRNPDPLVGDADVTIYTASRAIGPPREMIFKYWNSVDRSMFLQGFVLDTVSTLEFPSQLGHIPPEWPTLAGWKPKTGPPPEAFWRTLVADRGPDGRDPPSFYGPACDTVFQEAMDDTLDTSMLINHGSSVISDFLKRVQAVIWNRRMMLTANSWLGLAPKAAREGDLICILYGCSVPVVLRKVIKSQADFEKELEDEEIRKANVVAYIAKNMAARARRKRLDRATEEVDSVASGEITSKDTQKGEKRSAVSEPEAAAKVIKKKVPESTDESGSIREPPVVAPAKGGQALEYYYQLVGECYVHGMMNGESLTFRWNYNKGRRMDDRITSETFELR